MSLGTVRMFEPPYWRVFAEGYTASWFETVFLCAVNIVLFIGGAILFMLWRHAMKELKHLKEFELEQDDEIRSAKALQIIHKYLNDENLISIINELNELIANKKIPGSKVRGLYERYPYSFSDWIITKYGIFKQDPSWEGKPNKKLSELLQKKFKKEDLEPELKHYQGDYPTNLLAYCAKESPKDILDRLIGGIPDLRNIAKSLGIPAAKMIESKDELIKLILLRLGFNIPSNIVGMSQYRKFLDE